MNSRCSLQGLCPLLILEKVIFLLVGEEVITEDLMLAIEAHSITASRWSPLLPGHQLLLDLALSLDYSTTASQVRLCSPLSVVLGILVQSGIRESVERSTLVSILGNHLLSVSMGSLVTLNEAVYH